MTQDGNQESVGDFALYVAIGLTVGGLVYWGIKTFGPRINRVSVPPVPGPIIGGIHVPGVVTPESRVIALLQGSAEARKVFLFQAGMFSWHQTQERPDGVVGPKTREMIHKVNRAIDPSNNSAVFNDDVLRRLAPALRQLAGMTAPRLLPFTIPNALKNQVNADGVAVAPDVPLLQMLPA